MKAESTHLSAADGRAHYGGNLQTDIITLIALPDRPGLVVRFR